MKLKIYVSFFLTVIFAITSCKKDDKSGSSVNPNFDVYVVGTSTAAGGVDVATYWKNGSAIPLTDGLAPSSANAITVKGNNVYIAGTATLDNGKPAAVYWKNGIMTKLTNSNSGEASAKAIAVNGNDDVYVVGNAVNGEDLTIAGYNGFSAIFWKNYTATRLPDSGGGQFDDSYPNGIAFNGSDVYISGINTLAGPVYWKNGVLTSLSDGTSAEATTCIALNGSDIYVGGTTVSDKNVAFWKNGLVTVINDGSYMEPPSAILVNNNDVYLTSTSSLTGTSLTSNNIVATYWKNGVSTKFTDGTIPGYEGFISWATGIAVNGSDIYVSGQLGSDAVYWKNGVITHLAKNSHTTGIVVVAH